MRWIWGERYARACEGQEILHHVAGEAAEVGSCGLGKNRGDSAGTRPARREQDVALPAAVKMAEMQRELLLIKMGESGERGQTQRWICCSSSAGVSIYFITPAKVGHLG